MRVAKCLGVDNVDSLEMREADPGAEDVLAVRSMQGDREALIVRVQYDGGRLPGQPIADRPF